jgi:hypothetical protein
VDELEHAPDEYISIGGVTYAIPSYVNSGVDVEHNERNQLNPELSTKLRKS